MTPISIPKRSSNHRASRRSFLLFARMFSLVVASGIISAGMAWAIGAQDVAAMATSVGSKALTVKQAIIFGSICEFLGSLIGGSVCETITSGIVHPDTFSNPEHYIRLMFAVVFGAFIWLAVATYYEVPVSTTHALIGSLVGLTLWTGRGAALNTGTLGRLVASWVISPVLAALLSCGAYSLLARLVLQSDHPRAAAARVLPWIFGASFGVFFVTFAHSGTTWLHTHKPQVLMAAACICAITVSVLRWSPSLSAWALGRSSSSQACAPLLHWLVWLRRWPGSAWLVQPLMGAFQWIKLQLFSGNKEMNVSSPPLSSSSASVSASSSSVSVPVFLPATSLTSPSSSADVTAADSTDVSSSSLSSSSSSSADSAHLTATTLTQRLSPSASSSNIQSSSSSVSSFSLTAASPTSASSFSASLPVSVASQSASSPHADLSSSSTSSSPSTSASAVVDVKLLDGTALSEADRLKAERDEAESYFVNLLVLSACAVAVAHGSNDVSNAVAPFAAILNSYNKLQHLAAGGSAASAPTAQATPSWVLVAGGIGICVGLATYGYRVMATVGEKITKLTTTRGFVSQLVTASLVLGATLLGLSVSTTQVLVGSISGVALSDASATLNGALVKKIAASWFLTMPASALCSALIFYAMGH